jgi:lipopolysaccharide assembly outer membrane protein LptD (OstA)
MIRFLAAIAVCTVALTAQDYAAGQLKRLSVPTTTNVSPMSVAALGIEREGDYPAIIHLKGSVEIKTPVCTKAGQGSVLHCDGYVVLRADQADLREDSGEIEARGNVRVTREK